MRPPGRQAEGGGLTRVQSAMRRSSDPTLKSLLLAARLFDYLGMKWLYAVEWADYFRQLQANPDTKLVDLYTRTPPTPPVPGRRR